MSKKILKTVSVDMGNYNIKTNNNIIFKSTYEEYDYKNELLNDDVIMYVDRKYVIGKGEFDNTKVKSQKKNTLPLFLNAIYKSLNGAEYADINVVVGLPLKQHQNKQIVKELKDNYEGLFEFKYIANGSTKDIIYNINSVKVFPECLGAFYSINEDMEGRDVLLIDIGGGTVNIALFIDGEYEDSITLDFGTIDILRKIADKAVRGKEGATFSSEDIIKYMKRGKIVWDGKVDNMEYVNVILNDFADKIVNQIKGKFPLYKAYEIMLSGGGADLLHSQLSNSISFRVIPNNVFANAIGFYNVAVGADMDE